MRITAEQILQDTWFTGEAVISPRGGGPRSIVTPDHEAYRMIDKTAKSSVNLLAQESLNEDLVIETTTEEDKFKARSKSSASLRQVENKGYYRTNTTTKNQ